MGATSDRSIGFKNINQEEPETKPEPAIYDIGDELECDSITDSDSELGNNFLAFKHTRMEGESDAESDLDIPRFNLKLQM